MSYLEIKVGESSDSLNHQIVINQEAQSDLTNYVCEYIILDDKNVIVQTPVDVPAVNGVFPVRLTPDKTSGLQVGYYRVCVQITNPVLEFNQESIIPLQVFPQYFV